MVNAASKKVSGIGEKKNNTIGGPGAFKFAYSRVMDFFCTYFRDASRSSRIIYNCRCHAFTHRYFDRSRKLERGLQALRHAHSL